MATKIKGTTLYLALWRATRELQVAAEAQVRDSGLNLTDFAVLEVLLNSGPSRMSSIADKVLLTSGSATAAVDRLESRGLVRRANDDADGRVRVVDLTKAGRELIEPVFQDHEAALEKLAGALGASERRELLKLLRKLRKQGA